MLWSVNRIRQLLRKMLRTCAFPVLMRWSCRIRLTSVSFAKCSRSCLRAALNTGSLSHGSSCNMLSWLPGTPASARNTTDMEGTRLKQPDTSSASSTCCPRTRMGHRSTRCPPLPHSGRTQSECNRSRCTRPQPCGHSTRSGPRSTTGRAAPAAPSRLRSGTSRTLNR